MFAIVVLIAAPPQADKAGVEFFEKKIRPVLTSQCYMCHSEDAKKEKGNLLLDTRDGIRNGGDTGPAVVPGSPSKSLLLKAIKQSGELKMPPKSKLSEEVVADFEKWIATGAADPRDGKKAAAYKEIDIEKGRQFWAFQPPKPSPVPAPRDAAYDGLTDRAAVEMMKVGAAEHAKLRMLWVNKVHDNSHYGNLVTYLRIKGLAPSTEGQ